MSLNWKTSDNLNPFAAAADAPAPGLRFHHAESAAADDDSLKQVLEEVLARAVELLDSNVDDQAQCLLLEWNPAQASLRVSVSDASRQRDAQEVVICRLPALAAQEPAVCSEKLRFWAKDYLSTCLAFMRFSLLALYTDCDRARASLL